MIYLILLLGSLLRLINLNQSLWLDEAITALVVKNNSLSQLITVFSPGDFHPPLYYLFLKIWTDLFGHSEIVLRTPSIIFGLITVYIIGRQNKLAAFLLAINPLAVYYSQEARMYPMAMMFVSGAVLSLINRKWGWFVILATASIYTDYLPLLMFPVYYLLAENKKIVFAPLLLFLPWVPSLFTQMESGITASATAWGDLLGRANFKNLALVPAKFIFGRISLDIAFYALISGLYFFFIKDIKSKIYWLWFLVPLSLGYFLSLKVPVFTYFRFLFVLPAFCLLLAQKKKAVIVVSIVSLLSLTHFNLNSIFWREDWRSAVNYIRQDPGKIAMPNLAQAAPLEYYNLKSADTKVVYLFRYVQEIFDPQDLKRENLEVNGYKRVEERSFNNVLIWKYQQ